MVVAKGIIDSKNSCLMPDGAILSESSINGLRKRGILHITVEHEHELSAEDITAYRDSCLEKLEHKFRRVKDNADMQRLKNILLAYQLESME